METRIDFKVPVIFDDTTEPMEKVVNHVMDSIEHGMNMYLDYEGLAPSNYKGECQYDKIIQLDSPFTSKEYREVAVNKAALIEVLNKVPLKECSLFLGSEDKFIKEWAEDRLETGK